MTKLVYAGQAAIDLERLTNFLLQTDPQAAQDTAVLIIEALEILPQHPEIGRQAHFGQRENSSPKLGQPPKNSVFAPDFQRRYLTLQFRESVSNWQSHPPGKQAGRFTQPLQPAHRASRRLNRSKHLKRLRERADVGHRPTPCSCCLTIAAAQDPFGRKSFHRPFPMP